MLVLRKIENALSEFMRLTINAATALIVWCFSLLVLLKLMEWTVRSASWLSGY